MRATISGARRSAIRPQRFQVLPDPVAQGRSALRVEVKYGVFNGYSDSRGLLTGPPTLWEDEGDERWRYRWQTLLAAGLGGLVSKVGLAGFSNPSARSHGGSIVEWHHDANGGVENGSAPLYIWGDDKNIVLCLVNQSTSTCREQINLAPLQRSHWHDFIVHAKWSSWPTGSWRSGSTGSTCSRSISPRTSTPATTTWSSACTGTGTSEIRTSAGRTERACTDRTASRRWSISTASSSRGRSQASVLAERPWGTPAPDAGVQPPDPIVVADAGTPPGDGGTVVTPRAPDLDAAGTPAAPKTGLAAIGYPAGCTTAGSHLAWVAIPLLALAGWRRRRR